MARSIRFILAVVIVLGSALLQVGSAEAATPVTITSATVQNGMATITWTPLPSNHGVNSNGVYQGAFTICVVLHGEVPTDWILCSDDTGAVSPVVEAETSDSTATEWSGAATSLFGWQTGEYDAYVVYFTCDPPIFPGAPVTTCTTPVVSNPFAFHVVVKAPASKPPSDSIYVSETVEGGAHPWLKVDVSYLFGLICLESDPSWPNCSPAPQLELTIYRLGRAQITVGKRHKTVKTKTAVYYLSDTGINNAGGGGSMYVPPLVPSFDFRGGARSGNYLIKVTSSDLDGKSSDSTTFKIVDGQLLDG